MTYLALFAALLCAVAAWGFVTVRRISAVSQGPRIPDDRTETALLLIDLQTVFWGGATYRDATKSAVASRIAQEVEQAHKNGWPVIALRQEWSSPSTKLLAKIAMGGAAIQGSAGTELAAPFADLPDHMLVKRVQDGFETGALDHLLAELNVSHLRIAGLDGNYCVAKTSRAALARGYQVTLITAAIASAGDDRFATTQADLMRRGAKLD